MGEDKRRDGSDRVLDGIEHTRRRVDEAQVRLDRGGRSSACSKLLV